MGLESGLYQLLIADPGVSSWVGGRVFGGKMPRGATMPAIVWSVAVGKDMGYSTQGASGLIKKSVQFDSYANKYSDVVKTSDSIRALLQNYSGVLPDNTSVNGVIITRDMDVSWEPGAGGYVFRRLLEMDVMYTEYVLPFVPPAVLVPDIFDLDFDELDDDGEA
jgi:hypothetical protein